MTIFSFRQKNLNSYLISDAPIKHVPRAVQREARALTSVIVRTSALTDGRCTFASLHPHNCTSTWLVGAAGRALIGDTSPLAAELTKALPTHSAIKAKPIRSIPTPWQHSTWHNGSSTKTYWIGDIRLLEMMSDITENEREKYYLAIGRAHAKGQLAIIIGESTVAATKQQLPEIALKGLIIFQPQCYVGTAVAVRTLVNHHISIRYFSTQPLFYVDAIAHKAGLLQKTAAPTERTIAGLEPNKSVYAALTPGDEARLLAGVSAKNTLVVTTPLHDFAKKYEQIIH